MEQIPFLRIEPFSEEGCCPGNQTGHNRCFALEKKAEMHQVCLFLLINMLLNVFVEDLSINFVGQA